MGLAPTGPILLDNTVLTNFALVGEHGLLVHLWSDGICTTPAVMVEYARGVRSGLLPADVWRDLAVVTLNKDELSFAGELSRGLGAGERTCLAVAVHRHGLLVSDDLDARRAAQELGVPKTGTVGILVLCVRRGYLALELANAHLDQMVALGYRSPVSSLDPFV